MKLWTALLGAGVVVAVGVIFIGRDLSRDPVAPQITSEWRPAKQLTITTAGGVARSMHLQPDEKAVRGASLGRIAAFDRRWNDAQQIALRTPRIHLAAPVKDLQALARESLTIELTECLEPGREFWTAGLDGEVQALLAFMAQERSAQDSLQAAAIRDLANWTKVVEACG